MNKSAVPDERKTGTECCKQRWTLSVTNLRRSPVRGEKKHQRNQRTGQGSRGKEVPLFLEVPEFPNSLTTQTVIGN